MREVTNQTFGYLIAYLIPGFSILWSASPFSSTIRSWLGSAATDAPTVGGFVYVTIASVGAGLTATTIRWLVIDTAHHLTGIDRPRWSFANLPANLHAYDVLTENHYRYYQFYANMIVAVAIQFFARRLSLGFSPGDLNLIDLSLAIVAVLFFAGSRDTFRKYHQRLDQILGRTANDSPKGMSLQEKTGRSRQRRRLSPVRRLANDN